MGRFKHPVDSKECIKNFKTKYSIPPNVGAKYAAQGNGLMIGRQEMWSSL